MHGVEVERDRSDDGCGMQCDERKRRRCKRTIGLDAVARDQRKADAEQQIDQGNNGNGAGPPP